MRKWLLHIISLLPATIAFAGNGDIAFPITNNPLPHDTLRILMIGNSFTDDAAQYIGDIVKNSGIDEKTCCLYTITQGGAQLQTWDNNYKSQTTVTMYRRAGKYAMQYTRGTLEELLHQNWDVVSLQQVSNHSNDLSTFSPYLEELVSYIKRDCTNEHVAFCWHMAWSYWSGHKGNVPKEESGWKSIVSTVDKMTNKYGIDIIIPSGTAIQNARNTNLNTDKSLTRDGYHIDYGIGRYIVACTLFESLFEPVYGISILGNNSKPNIPDYDKEKYANVIELTEENTNMAQICAYEAVQNWRDLFYKKKTAQEVLIFPNPTKGDILVYNNDSEESDHTQFIVTDMLGNIVFNEIRPNENTIYLNISTLPKGLYLLSVIRNKKRENIRFEKI